MIKKIFSKSYWGLDWKSRLLTKQQIEEYGRDTLLPKNEIHSNIYEQYAKLLDDLIADEKERLAGIETKALQIVGQVSIVTTIVGLFAPFVLDKIPSHYLFLKAALIFGILVIALFFIYAIICALRNSSVSNFLFVKASENTIIDHYNGKIANLYLAIINDKILEFKANNHSTNAKASNVIYAVRAFKAAMMLLVVYIIVYSSALFFVPDSEQKILIAPESINAINAKRQPVIHKTYLTVDSMAKVFLIKDSVLSE